MSGRNMMGRLAICLALGVVSAHAADYPSDPVRIIVPYSAGGGSDLATRLFAQSLTKTLGTSIIVVNEGGAGGLLGTESYTRQAPDGYTLLLGAVGPLAIIPAQQTVSYDPQKDFISLGSIWESPQILAIRKDLGVQDFASFMAKAKTSADPLTMGDVGSGSLTYMAYAALQHETGVKFTSVPYKSGGAELNDLLGGHIDAMFAEGHVLSGNAKAGRIIAIATAATTRSPVFPDVPSTTELGYPNLKAVAWYGLLVSSKTPANIVTILRKAVSAAQVDPAYIAAVKAHGGTIGSLGADAFASMIRSEQVRWGQIVRDTEGAKKK
jgi:tripartite-type tricarboxylate transporter receptor subunit TctC